MTGPEQRRDSQIVLLGTGTPNPDPNRSGPSVAIIVNDTPYLIDAGPGIVRRAAAARRDGVEALRVSNLKHVFITHLHTDHTLGLADLIFTPWVLERAAGYVIDVCTKPAFGKSSGGYFFRAKPHTGASWTRRPELAERLWTLSEELVGLKATV